MTDAVVVIVTAANGAEAERIARSAVEAKLAACANLIPSVRSFFWWQGQVESAEEVLVLIKTRQEKLEPLLAAIRAEHSYEIFATVALPILGGNPDYLRWIGESLE